MSSRKRSFALLTRLFPARFRDEFAAEMEEVLRAEHSASSSRSARAAFWLHNLAGAVRSAPREHLDELSTDLRFILRTLRKRPLFLVVAVLSLGVGIGSTATVVATMSAVFLRPLPGVSEPQRLINVKVYSSKLETFDLTSYPDYRDLRPDDLGNGGSLEHLAGFSGTMVTFAEAVANDPELLPGQVVTSN